MKICSECGQRKPLEDFYKDKKVYYRGKCKECWLKASRSYFKEHEGYSSEQGKRYYARKKEQL